MNDSMVSLTESVVDYPLRSLLGNLVAGMVSRVVNGNHQLVSFSQRWLCKVEPQVALSEMHNVGFEIVDAL